MEQKLKHLGNFGLYFLGFLLVPSLIYSVLAFLGINGSDMLMTVICNTIYTILLMIILRKKLIKDVKDFKNNFSNYLGIMFKWWGIGLVIMMVSNLFINYVIFDGTIAANEEIARSYIFDYTFLSGISIMLLAPFTEEITFRYGLRKVFNNCWLYAISSGFIFGLLHAITDFSSALDLLYIIPYGALGFAFAALYHKTDNIIAPILVHMMHNTMTFMLVLLFM